MALPTGQLEFSDKDKASFVFGMEHNAHSIGVL